MNALPYGSVGEVSLDLGVAHASGKYMFFAVAGLRLEERRVGKECRR